MTGAGQPWSCITTSPTDAWLEAALAESEERFRSIFDQAPIGILRMDTTGRIVAVNPALCRLVGRRAEDLYGLPQSVLFATNPEIQGTADLEPLLHGDLDRLTTQRQFRRPDGEVRIGQVNDVGIKDRAGRLLALMTTVEDVTDRIEMAEELRRAQELEALGRLAGGIAHEINTPTQFISDNLAFLKDVWTDLLPLLAAVAAIPARLRSEDRMDELAATIEQATQQADLDFVCDEVPNALSQSQEGVERVASIVRAMKAFGHPDHSEPEPSDLNRIIADTVTVARSELKYVADVIMDSGPLPIVHCYPGALGQVVLNLLVNAAHAIGSRVAGTTSRGTITIRTWAEGDDACFSVTDTGTGIPDDVIGHIFEPFYTTKAVGQGTGQGLALAWSTIVERHKGRLSVTSSPDGACFTVRLPIHALHEAVGVSAAPSSAGVPARGAGG